MNDTHMQNFFKWDCGIGCNAERAAREWHMGKDSYEICGLCGEDSSDCECDMEKPEEHKEFCFVMN